MLIQPDKQMRKSKQNINVCLVEKNISSSILRKISIYKIYSNSLTISYKTADCNYTKLFSNSAHKL